MATPIILPSRNPYREKLTATQRAEIAQRYASGEYPIDLAAAYGVNGSTIRNCVNSFGVPKHYGRKSFLSREQKAEIIARYQAGEGSTTLAIAYGVKDASVTTLVRRHRIRVRTISESVRRLPLRQDAFSVVTAESAYWAGILMADGCISGRYHRISLKLKRSDKKHIEMFRDFLGSGHKISYSTDKTNHHIKGTGAYRIEVNSKQIANSLAVFGIVPNKSCREHVYLLENNHNFWRGMVDGDGTLGWQKSSSGRLHPVLALVGGISIMQQFSDFVQRNCGGKLPTVYKCKGRGLYKVALCGKRAKAMVTLMYKDPGPALDRKRIIAMDIIQST